MKAIEIKSDASIYITGSKRTTIFSINAKDFSGWKIYEDHEYTAAFASAHKNNAPQKKEEQYKN